MNVNSARADDDYYYKDDCTWAISSEYKLTVFPTDGLSCTLEGRTSPDSQGFYGWPWNDWVWDDTLQKVVYAPYSAMFMENVKEFYLADGVKLGASIKGVLKGASALTSVNVSDWDISNVIYMDELFSGASSLESIDLSNWDTSKVETMNNMFFENTSLWKLTYGSGFAWRTGGMNGVFHGPDLSDKWAILLSEDYSDGTLGNTYATGPAYSVDSLPSNPDSITTFVIQRRIRDIGFSFTWQGDLATAGRERPAEIIVRLYGNNELIDELQMSYDAGWNYTWEHSSLVFDDDSNYIQYSIRVYASDTNELLAEAQVRGNETDLTNTLLQPHPSDAGVLENPETFDGTMFALAIGSISISCCVFVVIKVSNRH